MLLQRSDQSANYSDVCRGGKKWISTRKLAPPPRAARPAAQPRPVSKTWFGCDRTQPQLSRQPDTAQLPRFIWCAVFDVSCCVLLFGVLSDVLSVLSDVWRSGRCLHPPRQGRGCVCLDISAWKSSIRRFVSTEKAPTRAFSWLKAATTAFTLRHY